MDIAIEFLKKAEGLRLQAYADQGGRLTIGYGHAQGVNAGDKITEDQANDLLKEDVLETWELISREIPTDLTDNMYAALISFTFNVGPGEKGKKDGFLELKRGGPSTLLKMLFDDTAPDNEIADQFLRWSYVGDVINSGLVTRRTAERKLFLTPDKT